MMVPFLLWCLLFVLCWPVAVLALLRTPAVWIISLPFRLVGICFESAFALLRAMLMLPARSGHKMTMLPARILGTR